ncbi:GATA transcription factor LreA [Aspergillus lucknowensis]|uniref:PAS domain-containing protein n=1 Tax=Aspergillus lucknowensis TaxID=176173 RepID=A0ABR4LES6_9EURO
MPLADYTCPPHSSMLASDPTAATSMSMDLGSGSDFQYGLSKYPSRIEVGEDGLNHPTSLKPRAPGPSHSAAQPQEPASNMYPSQHQSRDAGPSMQGSAPHQTVSSHLGSLADPASRGQSQDIQPPPQTSNTGSAHRYIQPKRSSQGKDTTLTGVKPESGEATLYSSIYSRSGFDMMGILAQVVARPDPKINIGPVDLSCAFVLCDITMEDHPIVYVSHAFERLTGYTEKEIVGQNCRFLQSPDGRVEAHAPRKFADSYTAFRLRISIEQQNEIQVSIVNYRKGGQPFMNLVTMIPVRWDSKDYRYFVGFQVDLVEKPDAVRRRNPDGTYMIDYHRNQLPSYVAPSPEAYQDDSDPATQIDPREVSGILDRLDGGHPVAKSHLLHALVENTDDIIFVLSFEGEFLYLSPACRTVLEYKSSDLLGKTLSTVCHPSDIGPVTRDLRGCTSGQSISVIYRIRRKHTGYAWFENHGAWHISGRGRQFMVLVGRIIPLYSLSQVTKTEQDESAGDSLWAKLSLSGIILFMSSKSRAVLGRAPEDLVGKRIQDLIVGDNSHQEPDIGQALAYSSTGHQATFGHKIRHRKGHIFAVQTTLYPGDMKEDDPTAEPTFLITQVHFPKPIPPQSASTADDQGKSRSRSEGQGQGSSDSGVVEPSHRQPPVSTLPPKPHPNYPEQHATSAATMTAGSSPGNTEGPSTCFEELNPTRGSNWQFALRELEKQNCLLREEVQRLVARRRKRKRKQTAVLGEKSCAMCSTKTTPEWRRGPSGNRDLCNSCGLRWAKQVKGAAQTVGWRSAA